MNSHLPKILFLNQYYPPDTSATAKIAQSLAEALAERYCVTVIAGRPSYNPLEYHPWFPLRRTVQRKVVIERVGSTAFSRLHILRRVSNYVSYLMLAICRALTIKADLVLVMTDPPIVGIAGRLISLLRRQPFLYYIQDLHPDMAMASGLVGTGFLVRIWENLHRWALRGASLVAVLGEDMRERVIAKGVDPRSVEVVPHGAPKQDNIASPDHPVTQEIRCGFPFVVLHAGNLGFYGAWGSLIEAARILDEEEVGFIFVGDGAAKPLMKTLASSCHNVRFLPFRPAGEVCYVLAAADIHVITIRKGLDGMVVPSKLYPILRAGRPVLAVTPEGSHVSRIVARSGCGIVADPEDPSSVAASIRDILRDRSHREKMSQCARAVAREYDRGEQLKHFVQLIKKIIGS